MALGFGLGAAADIAHAQGSDGFVPLFDGSTLAGWVIENDGNFRVEGDAIRVEGPGGWLRSDRQYGDFTLDIEFRFLTGDVDSGIFLRADGVTPFGRGWAGNSYQVQVRDITTNRGPNPIWLADIYRHRVAAGGETLYDADAALAASRPTGQWQRLEISALGDSLVVTLNDVPVTRAYGIVNPTGYIGIQGETGALEYRSIRIREE